MSDVTPDAASTSSESATEREAAVEASIIAAAAVPPAAGAVAMPVATPLEPPLEQAVATPVEAPDAAPAEAQLGAPADAPVDAQRLEAGAPGQWHRVSPKYLVVEIIGTVIGGLLFCAGAAVVWLVADQQWALWALVALVVIFAITLAVEPRRVRSIGYQLREDDLLFRRGIMFQRFVSVPYGRMQLVDITRSPVARWLGLAELKFVTAAATTGVVIPGLPMSEAEHLRDHLVALAESRRSGL